MPLACSRFRCYTNQACRSEARIEACGQERAMPCHPPEGLEPSGGYNGARTCPSIRADGARAAVTDPDPSRRALTPFGPYSGCFLEPAMSIVPKAHHPSMLSRTKSVSKHAPRNARCRVTLPKVWNLREGIMAPGLVQAYELTVPGRLSRSHILRYAPSLLSVPTQHAGSPQRRRLQ